MLQTLEKALETGWSVMIENLQEQLDAVIGPIVGRQKVRMSLRVCERVSVSEGERRAAH